MKITFFINNIYEKGGTEKVLSLIANALSKRYEIEIISLFKTEDKPVFNIIDIINILNIYQSKNENTAVKYLKAVWSLKKVLKHYKTDIFVVAGMKYFSIINVLLNKNIKIIAWEHFNSYIHKKYSLRWWGRVYAVNKADRIIVLTKKDKENYIKSLKCPIQKIVQIYNPMEYVKLEEEYAIHSKCIVSSGRLHPVKGFDMLVEVAEKVFNKHPDWEWHIYGEGEWREKIEKLIKEKQLEKNIILKGFSRNMNEEYTKYAFFVLTSRYEGLGMVNLEAHYAKLPIVAFDCVCGPAEIIQDGINGFLIKCFDINEMTDKINLLIENQEMRINMSNSTMLDKEKFQIENIIKKWQEIIEE